MALPALSRDSDPVLTHISVAGLHSLTLCGSWAAEIRALELNPAGLSPVTRTEGGSSPCDHEAPSAALPQTQASQPNYKKLGTYTIISLCLPLAGNSKLSAKHSEENPQPMKSSQCGAHLAVSITHALFILTNAHSYRTACVSTARQMSSVQKEKVVVFFSPCRG